MTRRPPGPTLFPYTTLFRSRVRVSSRRTRAAVLVVGNPENRRIGMFQAALAKQSRPPARVVAWRERSEEHTSELQSLRHLVCRLLLEKKKKKETKQTEAINT